MRKFTLLIMTLLMATTFLFTGCNKEKDLGTTSIALPSEGSGAMLCFSSTEEFVETRQLLLFIDKEERVKWEREHGFQSYATKCEKLFEAFESKGIESDDDIYAFVDTCPDYFYIYLDNDGEKYLRSYLEMDVLYAFVNENRLIRIGNRVYKVYDDGIFAAEDAESLSQITIDNHHSFMDNSQGLLVFPRNEEKGDTKKIFRVTNGNDRTLAEFRLQETPLFPWEVQFFMRPYHKSLGIWYWCNRHLSWDVSASWRWRQYDDEVYPGFHSDNGSTAGSTEDTRSSYTYIFLPINWYDVRDFSFTSIDGWAKTPSTDKCYCHL